MEKFYLCFVGFYPRVIDANKRPCFPSAFVFLNGACKIPGRVVSCAISTASVSTWVYEMETKRLVIGESVSGPKWEP